MTRWFFLALALSSCTQAAGQAAKMGTTTKTQIDHPGESVGPAPAELASHEAADEILGRADLAAYHGFVKYLRFRADHAADRFGQTSEAQKADEARFAEWTHEILEHPAIIRDLRGVVEWAYESPVDGSGQPFKFNIPTDYDAKRPAPLSLYMHGYSGNHLEHATGMADHPGFFEVSVLGRARGGRYRALSEADVLHVVEYIERHWAVDPARIHLNGGSMGGGGTFFLGARYPHRFASGRPVCGYASDKPLGNLLTFPIYATHSDDDWSVPILHSRGPMTRLSELGGSVVFDETTGYGHAVWEYQEGNARADAWYPKQVRPEGRQVKRIDYTALDGVATQAFWAQITEWGSEPAKARVVLEVEPKNVLNARLENVTRLRLKVSQSPIDPSARLVLSINGEQLDELEPPLPDSISVVRSDRGYAFEDESARVPTVRPHTPGGANQLYNGEPLLIVYGTRAQSELKRALREAAVIASRNTAAAWRKPNGELGVDGISHNQNLYGDLRVKADVDVTPEDVVHHHLVLIGTASQNAVVEHLASRLPVKYGDEQIEFNDGFTLVGRDRGLGLVYYNPEAPGRLIFWVASNDAKQYQAEALTVALLGAPLSGADCVVTRLSERELVVARSFDSRWTWTPRASTPLSESESQRVRLENRVAEAVRRALGADFAIAGSRDPEVALSATPGITELSDLINAHYYYEPLGVLSATGAELAKLHAALPHEAPIRFHPRPAEGALQPKRIYRVALSAEQIWPFVGATHFASKSHRVVDLTVADALRQSGSH